VTPADVQRVAAKYLRPANRTIGHFIPSEKAELVAVPETPDIEKLVADYKGRPPITAAESFEFSFKNIEARTRRSSLGGIRVASVPKKSRDEEVHISLRLHYGTAEELKPYREAASLLGSLMSRGTKKLNYQELKDELERIESTLTVFGSPGTISLSLRSKRPNLPAALDLLRQVLREPLLDASELEIIRQSRLAQLEQSRTEPSSLASTRINQTLYPYPSDDVRSYLTHDEEIARYKAVTIDQVRRLYADFLGAIEGELTIVGDFDPESTLKDFSKTFAGWESKHRYARLERKAFPNISGGKQSINTPDKANATYRAGLTFAMDDRDPDYPALVIGDYILGSSTLSSRLGDRIREKEGLSYGVGSSLNAYAEDKLTSFAISAICKPTNMSKVEKSISEELARLLKDGVTADELERAKTSWLQSEELSRSSDQGIASLLYRSLRTGQSLLDYDAAVEDRVKTLKPDDVLAALKRRIDLKRLVIVEAGDFEAKDSN